MKPPSCSECIHYTLTTIQGRDRPGCNRSQTTPDLRTIRPPKGGFEIAFERTDYQPRWRREGDLCGPTGKHFKARVLDEAQS